jgi:Zn-dependent peptidase ImmA (M78 family)/DNA-binding XRE family transcriptional regulator
MFADILAANLKRIRNAKGLTQDDLAQKAGISRAAYRNIESGSSVPRANTLQNLALALDVRIEALVQPVPVLDRVRFRTHGKLKHRDHILAGVAKKLEDMSELREMLGEKKISRFLVALKKAKGIKDPEESAKFIRGEFGLDLTEPIYDICGLLEARGVIILTVKEPTDAFLGLAIYDKKYGAAIVVNTWDKISVEQWIFSLAHELGHLLLHLDGFDEKNTEEDISEEAEANKFASYFLIPEKALLRERKRTYGMAFFDRIIKIKRKFNVSYKAIIFRMCGDSKFYTRIRKQFEEEYQGKYNRELIYSDEPESLTDEIFWANLSKNARNNPEPESLSPGDFSELHLKALVRNAIEKGLISMSRGAEILDLPLQKMRNLALSWSQINNHV